MRSRCAAEHLSTRDNIAGLRQVSSTERLTVIILRKHLVEMLR